MAVVEVALPLTVDLVVVDVPLPLVVDLAVVEVTLPPETVVVETLFVVVVTDVLGFVVVPIFPEELPPKRLFLFKKSVIVLSLISERYA